MVEKEPKKVVSSHVTFVRQRIDPLVFFFNFLKVAWKNGSLATMSSLAKDIIVYSFEKDIGGGRCLEAPWDRFFNIKGA